MNRNFLLTVFLASSLMPLLAQMNITQADTQDTNFLNRIPTEISWEAQTDNKKWAEQQSAIDQAKVDADSPIAILEAGVSDKTEDAKNAEAEAQSLRKNLLDIKKLIPKDPWREIYGVKKYVNSANSGFVKFSGQILEVAENGIRVLGRKGDVAEVEYFVIGFPYKFKVGESVDPTKVYVAFEDGDLSYVTEDGYAKKIPVVV
jgi:hypothetical protein